MNASFPNLTKTSTNFQYFFCVVRHCYKINAQIPITFTAQVQCVADVFKMTTIPYNPSQAFFSLCTSYRPPRDVTMSVWFLFLCSSLWCLTTAVSFCLRFSHQLPTSARRDHVRVVLVLVQLSLVLDYRLLFLLALLSNLSAEVAVLISVGPVAVSARAGQVYIRHAARHATRKSRCFPKATP